MCIRDSPYGGHEKTEVKNHFPADLARSETADLFMSVIMYRLKPNGRAAVILPDGFLFGTDNAKIAIKEKLLSEFNLHTIIRRPHSVFAPYTSITTNIRLDVYKRQLYGLVRSGISTSVSIVAVVLSATWTAL